jgi:hypothetical protein
LGSELGLIGVGVVVRIKVRVKVRVESGLGVGSRVEARDLGGTQHHRGSLRQRGHHLEGPRQQLHSPLVPCAWEGAEGAKGAGAASAYAVCMRALR